MRNLWGCVKYYTVPLILSHSTVVLNAVKDLHLVALAWRSFPRDSVEVLAFYIIPAFRMTAISRGI